MTSTIAKTLLLAMLVTLAPAAMAAEPGQSAGTTPAVEQAGTVRAPGTDGEIRKVDASGGKLTIRHGAIENLDMGAMTMIFRVKNPAMLTQVQAGDRVRFTAERVEGLLTVTSLVVEK